MIKDKPKLCQNCKKQKPWRRFRILRSITKEGQTGVESVRVWICEDCAREIALRTQKELDRQAAEKEQNIPDDIADLSAEVRRLQQIEAAKCGDCPFMRGRTD